MSGPENNSIVIPLEQGLRPSVVDIVCGARNSIVIPLEQGLRHNVNFLNVCLGEDSIVIPLEQGLRLSTCDRTEERLSILSSFH